MAEDTTTNRNNKERTSSIPREAPGREDSIRPNVSQTEGGSRFKNPTKDSSSKDSSSSTPDKQKPSKSSGSKPC